MLVVVVVLLLLLVCVALLLQLSVNITYMKRIQEKCVRQLRIECEVDQSTGDVLLKRVIQVREQQVLSDQ